VARRGARVLRLRVFNRGDYYGAVNQKVVLENITKVLYPNDEQVQGKELRLEQQYFFVSCSLQDMLRIMRGQKIRSSASTRSSRCSSTTPTRRSRRRADAPAGRRARHGLGRGLGDHRKTFAYTNHTLLPEALERWPLGCSARPAAAPGDHLRDQRALPRRGAHPLPGDEDRIARMSLIDESGERYVRMAHLATSAATRQRRGALHTSC
jgi:starch phosphorylase